MDSFNDPPGPLTTVNAEKPYHRPHARNQSRAEHFHDAKDLHSYLIRSWNELSPEDRVKDLIFYTTNGRKAARDVVVLVLLDALSQVLDSDVTKAQSLLFPVLYYFLLGEVMPGLMAHVLRVKLEEVIETLKDGSETATLPKWLNLNDAMAEEVLKVLSEWVGRMSSSEREPPVMEVRQAVVQRVRSNNEGKAGKIPSDPPSGCEKEIDFHRRYGLLTMNWASHDMFYEEELRRTFADFDFGYPGLVSEENFDVVDAEWVPNPLFIRSLPQSSDLRDEPNNSSVLGLDNETPEQRPLAEHLSNLGVQHDLSAFANEIVRRGAKAPEDQGLMEYTSYWFNGIAHAIAGLRDRVKVEVAFLKPQNLGEECRKKHIFG